LNVYELLMVTRAASERPGTLWTRRGLLWTLAGAAVGAVACRRSHPSDAALAPGSRFEGFPISRIDTFLTPTPDFFVRDHFGVPPIPPYWSLSLEGDVENPMTLGLADLAKLGRQELPVTLECAGNAGRNGAGWAGSQRAWGGASTASFQGVSLAELLARAKPRATVKEIALIGADEGVERDSKESHPFARSVPLEAALAPSALLATGMNGTDLPQLHGGPLRAVLPGRYATDSVKWLTRIRALSRPFDGFYQTDRYRRATRDNPAGVTLGELRVQSEVARPKPGDRLPQGLLVDITGVAWGGRGGIQRVQVSVDGGATFAEAAFLDPDRPFCWRRWRWSWRPDRPGARMIMARATDRSGVSQPLTSEDELGSSYSLSGPDRIQYADNAVPLIPVTVV
jgi:DMSO/TMAO reductase YedYZ molybdopterin-dependent catalytic subunit